MSVEKTIFSAAVLLIFSVLLVSEVRWIYAHPYGDGWDEAYYAGQGYRDYTALKSGDFMLFANTMAFGTRERPLAYRLAAMPLTFVCGPGIEVMRISSLLCYLGAGVLIFLTGRHLAGQSAGLIAAMLFLLSPTVAASSVRFYTEGVMYLAIATLLYWIALILRAEGLSTRHWIGLGLCTGMGLLTKVSFVVMAAVPLLLLFIFTIRRFGIQKSGWFFAKAALTAAVIGVPWWIKNYGYALGHLHNANTFVLYQLAEFGPALFWKYAYYFVQNNIGFLTAGLCLVAAGCYFYKRRKEMIRLTAFQKQMLLVCAGCGMLLPILQLTSVNHCMRLSSPVMVPLSVGVSLLFSIYRRPAALLLMAAVFAVQGGLMASSVRFKFKPVEGLWDLGMTNALSLSEQWDWSPLYEIAREYGLSAPAISLLGGAGPLNPGNVSYPWAIRSERVDVTRLPVGIREEELLEASREFDMIVTVWGHPYTDSPRFIEMNARNRSLFEALLDDGGIVSSSYLTVGLRDPITLRYGILSTGENH